MYFYVQRLYQSSSFMLQREFRVRTNCRKGSQLSTVERLMRKYRLSRCPNGHGSANSAFFGPKQNRSLQTFLQILQLSIVLDSFCSQIAALPLW